MKKINKKILIVEDDGDFLFILQKVLAAEGFSVVIAENGETGINAAIREKPDLIISDVLMPKTDGIAMANKLQELKITAPIVFLTNVENKDSDTKKFDYLIKSKLHIDEIVAKVKNKMGVK